MGTLSGENFSFRTCLTNESSHRNGQASQTSTPELIHGGNFPLSAIRQISDKSVPSEKREGGHFIPESFSRWSEHYISLFAKYSRVMRV